MGVCRGDSIEADLVLKDGVIDRKQAMNVVSAWARISGQSEQTGGIFVEGVFPFRN